MPNAKSIDGVKMEGKENKPKKSILDNISEDYVTDFEIYDKLTYESVQRRKKVGAKKAIIEQLDFLTRK